MLTILMKKTVPWNRVVFGNPRVNTFCQTDGQVPVKCHILKLLHLANIFLLLVCKSQAY